MLRRSQNMTEHSIWDSKLGDPEEVERCRRAAEQGDINAQFKLGNMYVGGRVPNHYAEAARWYRLAAKQARSRPKACSRAGMSAV